MGKVILVVEPDEETRRSISASLEDAQLRVLGAASAGEALEIAQDDEIDLVLTELVLPDLTGFGFARSFREREELAALPIVLLSGYGAEVDRLIAFEFGFDDFVAKPFSVNELRARLRAILRRPRVEARSETAGEPAVSAARLPPAVSELSELTDATPRELQILAELVRQEGRVVRREELLDRICQPNERCAPRTVDAHVKSLRRKLGPRARFHPHRARRGIPLRPGREAGRQRLGHVPAPPRRACTWQRARRD